MPFDQAAVLDLTPDQIEEEGSGPLLATVEIFGVNHHLVFIPVVAKNGAHVEAQPGFQDELDKLSALYEGPLQTVKVPGYPGDYVVYMHPFGD